MTEFTDKEKQAYQAMKDGGILDSTSSVNPDPESKSFRRALKFMSDQLQNNNNRWCFGPYITANAPVFSDAVANQQRIIVRGFDLVDVVKEELMSYENVLLRQQNIDSLAEKIVRAFAVKCGILQG